MRRIILHVHIISRSILHASRLWINCEVKASLNEMRENENTSGELPCDIAGMQPGGRARRAGLHRALKSTIQNLMVFLLPSQIEIFIRECESTHKVDMRVFDFFFSRNTIVEPILCCFEGIQGLSTDTHFVYRQERLPNFILLADRRNTTQLSAWCVAPREKRSKFISQEKSHRFAMPTHSSHLNSDRKSGSGELT